MAWISLHRHNVAHFQAKVGGVAVIPLTGILKLHLHDIGSREAPGYVGEPVMAVKLATRLPPAAATSASA